VEMHPFIPDLLKNVAEISMVALVLSAPSIPIWSSPSTSESFFFDSFGMNLLKA
jgi:hypothetical protein